MLVKSVRISNYRSIKDETLDCDRLVALVGANGSGKSSFLHALEMFYGQVINVSETDFYNEDTKQEISIAVTFVELNADDLKRFAKYIQDKQLTVERVFAWSGEKVTAKYHGSTLQNPDFVPIRLLEKATPMKAAYSTLMENPKYKGSDVLPSKWTKLEEVLEALDKWEEQHPKVCERTRDQGQSSGSARLGRAI